MIDINAIKKEYIDQITAARILNVSQARISQLCSQGRFEGAEKIGWSWIIPREAVANFKRQKRGVKPYGHDVKQILKQACNEAIDLKEGALND